MSLKQFGVDYAGNYDDLYCDKDYEAECDLLESAFRQYADFPVKTILDLGCGTGNHLVPLARRGYELTGVDRSREMLNRAKEKSEEVFSADAGQRPAFHASDIRGLDLNRKFDVVLMMFAVMGYQLTNEDVLAAFETVRRHLRPGGLFIFDVWYGPAVLTIRPGDKVKVIPTEDGKLIRAASGALRVYDHLAEVHYHVLRVGGGQVLNESEETHLMRYFFPQELNQYMERVQLTAVNMSAFGDLAKRPTESTWNILVVSRSEAPN